MKCLLKKCIFLILSGNLLVQNVLWFLFLFVGLYAKKFINQNLFLAWSERIHVKEARSLRKTWPWGQKIGGSVS